MTESDHITIATTLREIHRTVEKDFGPDESEEQKQDSQRIWSQYFIEPFARSLANDNPLFNREKFIEHASGGK